MTKKNIINAAIGSILLVLALIYFMSRRDVPQAGMASPQATGQEGEPNQHGPGDLVSINDEQMRSAGIELVKVEAGSGVELVFPATVNAAPTASARVDARASGVVQSITKTLGDPVRRGQTLANIESAEAASLASQQSVARARVTELQSAFAREKQLFDANVTARQDLEAAQANLSVARSELARAQAAFVAAGVSNNGRSLAVTSPLGGRITAAPAVLGSYVNAGEELFRIVDPSRLQIQVAVLSADAGRIAPGDQAIVSLPGGGEIEARVRSITPSLDADSRSAVAVLSLTRAASGLQPGAFVETRILPASEALTGGYSVPADAVQAIEGQDVVFVKVKGGFKVQPVRIGKRSGGRVAIASGLTGSETIAGKNAFLIKAELGKAGAEHDE